MAQQIASMFGALGFKVDTTGLELFKTHMQQAKSDMVSGARATNILARKFRDLNSALEGVVNKLDKVAIKKANQNIAGSYKDVADSVALIDKALNQIADRQPRVTKAFGKIHSALTHGNPLWQNYLKSVRDVKTELADVHNKMSTLRQNSSVRLRVTGAQGAGRPVGSTTSGGTQTSFSRPNYINPQQGAFGAGAMGGMGGGFFRSMLPATALAGGLPTAGYALKEVVQRGRAQQRMENVLLFSSKNMEDFNDSLQFVRKESLRLGLDTAELGKSFAQVNMSAGDKLSKDEKKKMFTDMSEYIMTTGASGEDQKLIFKAIQQMFSLGRIQAEELNQLTERGIPRAMIYDKAMEVFGVKSHAEVMKLQEQNKLDPAKLLPVVFEAFAKQARDTGAYQKALDSSQTKQNIMNNKFNALSQQIMEGGLDASLAKLFELLSQLIDLLSEIIEGFKTAKKTMDEYTDGNSGLVTLLLILLPLILRKGKAIRDNGRGLSLFGRIAQIVTSFLNGRMLQAIINVTKRFGWWGLAISGVLTLLQQIGKAMKGRANGEWTWVDTLSATFKSLSNRIEIAWLRFKIFRKNLGKKFFSFGTKWTPEQLAQEGYAAALAPKSVPMKGAAAEQKKAIDKAVKTTEKIIEQSKRSEFVTMPKPLEGATPMVETMKEFFDKQPISQNFNIYLNGELQKDWRVTSELIG